MINAMDNPLLVFVLSVEPNPNCGMELDGSDRHLLQPVDRLWCAQR